MTCELTQRIWGSNPMLFSVYHIAFFLFPLCIWYCARCHRNTPQDFSMQKQQWWQHQQERDITHNPTGTEIHTIHLFIPCDTLTIFSLPPPPLPVFSLSLTRTVSAPWSCQGLSLLLWRLLSDTDLDASPTGPLPPHILPSDTPDCPGSRHPLTCHPDHVTPTPGKISRCILSKTQRPEWGDWQGAGPLRTQGRCQVAKKREIDFRVKLKIRRMCFNTPLADSSFCGTRKRGVTLYSWVPSVCYTASLPTSERVNSP